MIFLMVNYLCQLLAMIGEQFDCGDEICGAVVNIRPGQDKISIWTKNASNEAAQVIATIPMIYTQPFRFMLHQYTTLLWHAKYLWIYEQNFWIVFDHYSLYYFYEIN